MSVQLNPTDDAYVKKDNPGTNYGGSTELVCTNYTSNRHRIIYLKFDISGLKGATILDAKLWLYQDDNNPWGGSRGDVSAYKISDVVWLEGTITWNNRPASGDLIDTVDCALDNTWYDWDLKDYVQERASADEDYLSVAMDRVYEAAWSRFKPKEYGSLIPYLEVDYVPTATRDLKAEFYVPYRGSADLKAEFVLRTGIEDLKAVFVVGQGSVDLHASFWIPIPASVDLFAEFETNLEWGTPADLFCEFHVRRIYDLSDSGGIGFFWKGVGAGMVNIEILTPTGAWIGKFPEWPVWTWVALKWEDLQEVAIDGSRPDKSRITGILWTYHTPGIRHLDWVVGLPKGGDRDIFGEFIVRHSAFAELKGIFTHNHYRADLKAGFVVLGEQPGRLCVSSGRLDVGDVAAYYRTSGWDVYPLGPPQGRKCFKAVGRWWIFYAEGYVGVPTNRPLVYKSMPIRGTVWGNRTEIAEFIYGSLSVDWEGRWAVHWDGTYVHLTYSETNHGSISYRRGQPQSDGTITWGTVHEARAAIADTDMLPMSITVDSTGHPFIAYRRGSTGTPYVINSSTNDGTWVTDQDYQISGTSDIWYLTIVALQNGNIICISAAPGRDIREAVWNGAAWSVSTFHTYDEIYFNAVPDGNDVHLVFYVNATKNVYHMKRTWGVGWSSTEFIFTTTDSWIPALSMGYGWENQGELALCYWEISVPKMRRRFSTGVWTDPLEGPTAPKGISNYHFNAPLTYSGGRLVVFYAVPDYPAEFYGEVYAWKIRCFNAPEIKAEFTVRQLTNDLKAEFTLRQLTNDLKAEFFIPCRASADLKAEFITYPFKDLKAEFVLRQLFKDLKAVFRVEMIEVYMVEPVSGSTVTCPINDSEELISEMTKTITGMLAGDKVKIHFDCSLYNQQAGTQSIPTKFRINVNGAQIGKREEMAFKDTGSNFRMGLAMERYYEIPSNGDYTFTVTWQCSGAAPTYMVQILDGLRTMVITHMR